VVGTGFTNKLQGELLQKLKPLQTTVCPFKVVPDYNKPSRFRPSPPKAEVIWLKPEIVCEISYREMTKDGAIRHPSFKGLREDKAPSKPPPKGEASEKPFIDESVLVQKKIISPLKKSDRKTLLNPKAEMQTRNIGGHDLNRNLHIIKSKPIIFVYVI
jgi:bifunctional non-homologous end joining protein LigD